MAGARELTGGGQPAAPACTPRPLEDVLCLCGAPDVRTLLWVFLRGTWVSFATGSTLGWELEGSCQCGPDDLGQSEAPAEAAAPSCSEPGSLRGRVGCGGTGARGSPILTGRHNRGRCITCFPVSPGETWMDPSHPPGPSSPGLR